MILSLLYMVLAAFGLGFLIFIHEFGHYWMARREGMTVEAFSIGFGKPIYTWVKDGVKWQLCWLPFGGFVRIAGMEKKGTLEPYQIPDGFFGKKPVSRIKVALMGPVVNIVFAFIVFSILWTIGGRQKPFSEYTHLIGNVDPSSAIYNTGIRPGDEIVQLNNKPFRNFQDFLYSAIFYNTPPLIAGIEHNYLQAEKRPFQYQFNFAKGAPVTERITSVLGSIQPASFLIYNRQASLVVDANSPMTDTGIEDGDRILWVDGELMFSRNQLVQTINQPKALLTIKRGELFFLARVPRLPISDFRLNAQQKSELEDWQHEANIKGKLADLYFVPYNLTASCQVENAITYFNAASEEQRPQGSLRSELEIPLQPGDIVMAVDGIPVSSSYEMMSFLQTRHIQIIVKKPQAIQPISWKEADLAFVEGIRWDDLNRMVQSIGTNAPIKTLDTLQLLNPAAPKPLSQMSLPEEKRAQMEAEVAAQQKAIDEIQDPKERALAKQMFDAEQNLVKLGIVMSDRGVNYNPSPLVLFGNVFQETYKTLFALFSGNVSPKYMTGPVGIVHVMQQSWGQGFKEALFWLGMISLNLGLLNLLPIPVLDGGHICFSLWESITKKPIKAKTMERLIIPFIVLLVALFIYLTYNDLMRLFTSFWS